MGEGDRRQWFSRQIHGAQADPSIALRMRAAEDEGIWIDEQLLHRAGIGRQWQAMAGAGAARVNPDCARGGS